MTSTVEPTASGAGEPHYHHKIMHVQPSKVETSTKCSAPKALQPPQWWVSLTHTHPSLEKSSCWRDCSAHRPCPLPSAARRWQLSSRQCS